MKMIIDENLYDCLCSDCELDSIEKCPAGGFCTLPARHSAQIEPDEAYIRDFDECPKKNPIEEDEEFNQAA